MNEYPEIIYLKNKSREPVWEAFNSSYKEAVDAVQKEHTEEDITLNVEYSVPVLAKFEENLKSITGGRARDFIEYHMDILRSSYPELMHFPQEIVWSIMRSKYLLKNNILEFRERDHIVSFPTWYFNMFNIAALKFLDNPSLFDSHLTISEKMINIGHAKKIIDSSVEEALYTSMDWGRLFECKIGLVCMSNMPHTSVKPVAPTPPPSAPSTPSATYNNNNNHLGSRPYSSSQTPQLEFGSPQVRKSSTFNNHNNNQNHNNSYSPPPPPPSAAINREIQDKFNDYEKMINDIKYQNKNVHEECDRLRRMVDQVVRKNNDLIASSNVFNNTRNNYSNNNNNNQHDENNNDHNSYPLPTPSKISPPVSLTIQQPLPPPSSQPLVHRSAPPPLPVFEDRKSTLNPPMLMSKTFLPAPSVQPPPPLLSTMASTKPFNFPDPINEEISLPVRATPTPISDFEQEYESIKSNQGYEKPLPK